MLELVGIVAVRRPEGGRWNDGAAYWFGVCLRDADGGELYEEAPVEEIQSYSRFQCFVAREFGLWYRYEPAEDETTGQVVWSEYVGGLWGRRRIAADAEPPPYFDAAPWAPDES